VYGAPLGVLKKNTRVIRGAENKVKGVREWRRTAARFSLM
jgi:hypothetical protein